VAARRLRRTATFRPRTSIKPQVIKCRPRASGDRPCPRREFPPVSRSTPRERGSSLAATMGYPLPEVDPARAGIVRCATTGASFYPSRPRASGDRPSLSSTAPMARGSTPRERGSSGVSDRRRGDRGVDPARAGIVPWRVAKVLGVAGRPRASGDRPGSSRNSAPPTSSTPRERGSSVEIDDLVLRHGVDPARAGIVPAGAVAHALSPSRPRASGDHPIRVVLEPPVLRSARRERGLSPVVHAHISAPAKGVCI
jgi:hypothetical protein